MSSGKIKLDGSAAQRLDQLDRRETELLEELRKSRQTCKKLKEDRAQYRKRVDEKESVPPPRIQSSCNVQLP